METIQPEVTKCQDAECFNVFPAEEIREEKEVLALVESVKATKIFFKWKSVEIFTCLILECKN